MYNVIPSGNNFSNENEFLYPIIVNWFDPVRVARVCVCVCSFCMLTQYFEYRFMFT